MAEAVITWDDAALSASVHAPSGPVARGLARIADLAVLQMKRRIPVYHGPPRIGPVPGHPRQIARRPGTLRSSVRKIRQNDGSYLIGPTDMVGGQLLGPLIERGTPPHEIRSHGSWPLYSAPHGRTFGHPVYEGPPGNRRLVEWRVRHPGTRPQPFIDATATALNGTRERIS
jgi:hypothetical protein